MLFGLVVLIGLTAPANALEPYPGETREAFVARSALEQQRKLAEADAAAGALTPGLASGGGTESSGGFGGLQFGAAGLAMLLLGGLRMSRSIFRASRSLTKKPGGQIAGVDTFQDRLAARLRELDQPSPLPSATPVPQHGVTPEPTADPQPPRLISPVATGPRTFGRRVD